MMKRPEQGFETIRPTASLRMSSSIIGKTPIVTRFSNGREVRLMNRQSGAHLAENFSHPTISSATTFRQPSSTYNSINPSTDRRLSPRYQSQSQSLNQMRNFQVLSSERTDDFLSRINKSLSRCISSPEKLISKNTDYQPSLNKYSTISSSKYDFDTRLASTTGFDCFMFKRKDNSKIVENKPKEITSSTQISESVQKIKRISLKDYYDNISQSTLINKTPDIIGQGVSSNVGNVQTMKRECLMESYTYQSNVADFDNKYSTRPPSSDRLHSSAAIDSKQKNHSVILCTPPENIKESFSTVDRSMPTRNWSLPIRYRVVSTHETNSVINRSRPLEDSIGPDLTQLLSPKANQISNGKGPNDQSSLKWPTMNVSITKHSPVKENYSWQSAIGNYPNVLQIKPLEINKIIEMTQSLIEPEGIALESERKKLIASLAKDMQKASPTTSKLDANNETLRQSINSFDSKMKKSILKKRGVLNDSKKKRVLINEHENKNHEVEKYSHANHATLENVQYTNDIQIMPLSFKSVRRIELSSPGETHSIRATASNGRQILSVLPSSSYSSNRQLMSHYK